MKLGRQLLRSLNAKNRSKKSAFGTAFVNIFMWYGIDVCLSGSSMFNFLIKGTMLGLGVYLVLWESLYACNKIKHSSWAEFHDILQGIYICIALYVFGYYAYYNKAAGWHKGIDSSYYVYITQLISWIVWIVTIAVVVHGGKKIDAGERALTAKEEMRYKNIKKWMIAVVPLCVAFAILTKKYLNDMLKKFPADTGTSLFFIGGGILLGVGLIAVIEDWLAMRREEKQMIKEG